MSIGAGICGEWLGMRMLERPFNHEDVAFFSAARDRDENRTQGLLRNLEVPSGLGVHVTDTVDVSENSEKWNMAPAFVVAIILEGVLEARLDNEVMHLGTGAKPIGQYWNLVHETRIERMANKGTHVRKVIIAVPRHWIDAIVRDLGSGSRFVPEEMTRHYARGTWAPSPHAISMAEQLVRPSSEIPSLQLLSTEIMATEIVKEAIQAILSSSHNDSLAPTTVEARRAKDVRDRILDDLSADLNLESLARELGVSVGSMQAAFKATYATTIGAFIRTERLARAKYAIEFEGRRVSEAAYLAGYDSPASFSTAFRREFGFMPSRMKR